jgi:hypothetical protein
MKLKQPPLRGERAGTVSPGTKGNGGTGERDRLTLLQNREILLEKHVFHSTNGQALGACPEKKERYAGEDE